MQDSCSLTEGDILTENNTIIKKKKLAANSFKNYFANIVKTLKLKKHPNLDGQLLASINEYFKNNEIVIKIKRKYDTQEYSFSFTLFSKEDIPKPIKVLSDNKISPFDIISTTILKNSISIYLAKLTNLFNECLSNDKFPDTLKRADVTLIFKNE